MKIAYFDCSAGAGGDMLVASMLDAGLDAEFLKSQLATLGLKNLDIKITQTKRIGLCALSFVPVIPRQHSHRNLKQITEIINNSKISDKAKKTAITIFERLGRAEATVHGEDVSDVHFHEIGAIDSIADIVCASVGLEALGIEKVFCSALNVGGGTVKCSHGIMPVPAPATAELIKGVPIAGGPIEAELLTPTAAAILTTVVEHFGPLPQMKIEAVGYGAGTLDAKEFANVVRLLVGQSAEKDDANADSVCLLETNIDDISGELVGSVIEQLFENGAADVFTTPIYMKSSRPAVQLSVICEIKDIQKLERIIFSRGLTFGIRKQILQRSKLPREFVAVDTRFGKIKIKAGLLDGKVVNAKPEFADCSSAARKHNVAVKEVLDAATAAYQKQVRQDN